MSLLRSLNTLRKDLVHLAFSQGKSRKKSQPKIFNTEQRQARQSLNLASTLAVTPMRVLTLTQETTQAMSIELARIDRQAIDLQAGMFLTLVVSIEGQEHRRAYSISSACQQQQTVTVTIKRVKDGKVSNYLLDHIKVGDTLPVLGPSGAFVLDQTARQASSLLLVGGGSGITPLMSMIRSLLAEAQSPQITLLYANRCFAEVIFAQDLIALANQHPQRLRIAHVLEQLDNNIDAAQGLLDKTMFSQQLTRLFGEQLPKDLQIFICGPSPMMLGIQDELAQRAWPKHQIHQENFTPALSANHQTQLSEQPVTIKQQGRTWSGQALKGQSLLEAGLAIQAPMPFSCTLGGCGHCRVKVTQGEVFMPEPNCLLPEEKEQGYVLACIAHACTPVTVELETNH